MHRQLIRLFVVAVATLGLAISGMSAASAQSDESSVVLPSPADPKIKSGTGERDYRLGVAVLWSRGRGKLWSGGGFEGDLVAQRFELVDVVTFFAFRADAVVVEVGTQVVEAGLGI
jgi:hypothetical protein